MGCAPCEGESAELDLSLIACRDAQSDACSSSASSDDVSHTNAMPNLYGAHDNLIVRSVKLNHFLVLVMHY